MHGTLTLSQDLQVFMSQCTPPPSLLLLPCPYLSIGLGYLGGVKDEMQNTGEPMPKFFTGLDLCFGADTEAKISILTGSNFDQYCTD